MQRIGNTDGKYIVLDQLFNLTKKFNLIGRL